MKIKLSEKEYSNILKRKRTKINGYLKSSIRKKSPEISYENFMRSDYMLDSDYMFSEYLKMKKAKKYQPKILIIQTLLNILLFTLGFYFFEENLFFETLFIALILFINWFIIWFYSLISVIKNSFKKKRNKFLWLILILFLPISAFFYSDFKKVQIENDF